ERDDHGVVGLEPIKHPLEFGADLLRLREEPSAGVGPAGRRHQDDVVLLEPVGPEGVGQFSYVPLAKRQGAKTLGVGTLANADEQGVFLAPGGDRTVGDQRQQTTGDTTAEHGRSPSRWLQSGQLDHSDRLSEYKWGGEERSRRIRGVVALRESMIQG